MPSPDIPDSIILELDRLRTVDGLSLEDAITNIRGGQVPEGHSPYPFRRDTRESLLDKLRSVVATCRFRANIEYWKERGADFSTHLYVPKSILLLRKRGMTEETTTTFSAGWQKVYVKAKTLN